jgi:transketolase
LAAPQLKRFRQLHSKTPGHPELTRAPSGVETTTGPLGQGVASAVGMAVGAKMAAARFNTPEHTIFDHHIVCLAGDGCMQEGVAMEAVAFAGHQKLDNLILIYDCNAVTLDAMADASQSEDTRQESTDLELVLLSAGSELQHALKAADILGPGTRVVSMPSFFRFNRQSAEYRESVLPGSCRRRVAIEASVSSTWAPYVGLDGVAIGIDRFGLSAPGSEVMKELGITAEHMVEVARGLK